MASVSIFFISMPMGELVHKELVVHCTVDAGDLNHLAPSPLVSSATAAVIGRLYFDGLTVKL